MDKMAIERYGDRPRYIDADLLLKDISESVVFTVRNAETSPELRGARKIIDRIENAPTADVAEVVRCKGCKRYSTELRMCLSSSGIINAKPDDFCSCGERKDA